MKKVTHKLMSNFKERAVKRLPSIMVTKSGGFLKLNEEQKEVIAERLEIFLRLELGLIADTLGEHKVLRDIPTISMN